MILSLLLLSDSFVGADADEVDSNLIPSCLNARGFKMALLNIVSLPNHVDELRISINSFFILTCLL